MKRLVALVILAAIRLTAAEPKPLLVVLEQNPWLMAIGSDSPTFALYDDGTVVYLRTEEGGKAQYRAVVIPDATKVRSELISPATIVLTNHYALTDATDQLNTVLWTDQGRIELYGNWRHSMHYDPIKDHVEEPWIKEMFDAEKKKWEALPKQLRDALVRIDEFKSRPGKVWLPEFIEVMLWPCDGPLSDSKRWPEDWPSLSAPSTKKRTRSYSLYVPSKDFDRLRKYLATSNEVSFVQIDNKRMCADCRFPFPGEERWME